MAKGKNTKSFRLPVNSGIKADTFAEDVTLQDSNNFVLLPDGSGSKPREGYEIRSKDVIGLDTGRKTIYHIASPPDISNGDLIVIVNNKNGTLRVENTEVVKSAGVPNSVAYSPSSMQLDPYLGGLYSLLFLRAEPGVYTTGRVNVFRVGDTTGYAYCSIRPTTGTVDAVMPGTIYEDFTQQLVFAPGEIKREVFINILTPGDMPLAPPAYINIELYDFSPGSGLNPSRSINPLRFYFLQEP